MEVKVKRTYLTGELHKYVLLFSFHNGNNSVVSGWKLDIFIPHNFTVSSEGVDEHSVVNIENNRYRKFQVSSTETLLLGESVDLINPGRAKLEYEIDNDIYYSARDIETKIIWSFYSSSEPPITGELEWENMQQY